MSDELTQEEQAALDEMQADDSAPAAAPETPEQQAAEFEAEAQGGDQKQRAPAETGKPPEGYIPHGAFHSEREARKQLQAQLAEMQAELEKLRNPPEPEPQYVDPIEDPDGFRQWALHQEAQRSSQIEQTQQAFQQAQAMQQRLQSAAQAEQEFAAKTPDYQQAVTALQQARQQELASAGYTQQQIAAQLQHDANSIFDAANAAGMNPAELLYMRAQASGYTRQAAPQQAPAAQQMQAVANAQRQTQPVTGGGGQAQAGLTASQLAEMGEEEFNKLDPAEIRKAMGG